MDIRRRLSVTLAAMILAGQLGATLPATAASQAQLETLHGYLMAEDLTGLASYLEENPALLEAGTPLSGLLGEFLAMFRGNLRLVLFPPGALEEVTEKLATAVNDALY